MDKCSSTVIRAHFSESAHQGFPKYGTLPGQIKVIYSVCEQVPESVLYNLVGLGVSLTPKNVQTSV